MCKKAAVPAYLCHNNFFFFLKAISAFENKKKKNQLLLLRAQCCNFDEPRWPIKWEVLLRRKMLERLLDYFSIFFFFQHLKCDIVRQRCETAQPALEKQSWRGVFSHPLITVVVSLHITGRVFHWRAREHTGKINGGEWRGAGGCGWADGWWSKAILFSFFSFSQFNPLCRAWPSYPVFFFPTTPVGLLIFWLWGSN